MTEDGGSGAGWVSSLTISVGRCYRTHWPSAVGCVGELTE